MNLTTPYQRRIALNRTGCSSAKFPGVGLGMNGDDFDNDGDKTNDLTDGRQERFHMWPEPFDSFSQER